MNEEQKTKGVNIDLTEIFCTFLVILRFAVTGLLWAAATWVILYHCPHNLKIPAVLGCIVFFYKVEVIAFRQFTFE